MLQEVRCFQAHVEAAHACEYTWMHDGFPVCTDCWQKLTPVIPELCVYTSWSLFVILAACTHAQNALVMCSC